MCTLIARLGFGKRSQSPRDIQRILLVALDHLGDCVITSGMCEPLRRRFPEAQIDVLAGAWTCELFAACPEVNRVFVSRVNRFARPRPAWWWVSVFSWGWRLRREKYDLAIDVRGELPLALLTWLTGAPRRLGWNAGGGGFLLTDSAAYVAGRPEVQNRAALLAALEIAVDDSWPRRAAFAPDRQARNRIAAHLAGGAQQRKPVFVLHLGAGTAAKQWSAAAWQELLGRLIVEHDPRIVLVGTAADRELAEEVLAGRAWPGVSNWLGQLSLLELAALLERADLFVGGDSGPAHMAAALDRPTVVLMSGTNHLWQWRPQGRNVAVLRHNVACSPCHRSDCAWHEHPCMAGLTPAAVAMRIEHLLQRQWEHVRQTTGFSAQLRPPGNGLRFR